MAGPEDAVCSVHLRGPPCTQLPLCRAHTCFGSLCPNLFVKGGGLTFISWIRSTSANQSPCQPGSLELRAFQPERRSVTFSQVCAQWRGPCEVLKSITAQAISAAEPPWERPADCPPSSRALGNCACDAGSS